MIVLINPILVQVYTKHSPWNVSYDDNFNARWEDIIPHFGFSLKVVNLNLRMLIIEWFGELIYYNICVFAGYWK